MVELKALNGQVLTVMQKDDKFKLKDAMIIIVKLLRQMLWVVMV
jgi:hypothetical protein